MNKTTSRRFVSLLGALLVLGMLAAGCSKPEEAPAPAPKGAEVLPDKGMNPGSQGMAPVSGKHKK